MRNIIGDKCRAILMKISDENKESSIYPMWDEISDLLQKRNPFINEFFEEVESQLDKNPIAIRTVLECILNLSSRFNLEEMESKKNRKRDVERINKELLVHLEKVSMLLKRKDILCAENGIFDTSESNILSLILDASKNNLRFQSLMKPEIEGLRYQYIDYLPNLINIFEQLKDSIQDSNVQFQDNIIEDALSGHKSVNRTTFVKTIYNVIDENKMKNYGFIPDDFDISYKNMATLVNCVLNLEDKQTVGSGFIKTVRQNMKH